MDNWREILVTYAEAAGGEYRMVDSRGGWSLAAETLRVFGWTVHCAGQGTFHVNASRVQARFSETLRVWGWCRRSSVG